MRADYRIADADRHVMETVEVWQKYLPEDLRDRAPYAERVTLAENPTEAIRRYGPKAFFPLLPLLMLDGKSLWHKVSPKAHLEMSWAAQQVQSAIVAAMSSEGQLQAMDRHGVDVSLLFPTLGLCLLAVDSLDPVLGEAFVRAYNDWLRDYCARDPQRLRGVGMISLHDPTTAAAEVERIAGFGWTAVMIPPNPIKGRLLSDPAYEPFWSTCERFSVAVALHGATHTHLPTAGADRFQTHFALHACAHPLEQMMAMLALIEGGVLERHPGVNVAFLESGCGWLPYWLHRLDEVEYARFSAEVSDNVKLKPSEYFKRQCYVTIEPDEPYLPAIIDAIGPDNLMFGSDYPHPDHDDNITTKAISLAKTLPRDILEKILWHNAARCYGLK